MNKTLLKNNIQKFNESIKEFADKMAFSTDRVAPIYDGIADVDKYLSCGKRIMWVLKEPYDNITESGETYGGDWSIVDDCFSGHGEDGNSPKFDVWSNKTWQPIIYAMYGYFNNLEWQSMQYIRDQKNMANILQQIAYINISKMPNKSRSSEACISNFYNQWKSILFQQIDIYNPDVVIFGNTFKYFQRDLQITEDDLIKEIHIEKVFDPYKKNGRLWLSAYHPNQTQVSREIYVNSIIRAIQGC